MGRSEQLSIEQGTWPRIEIYVMFVIGVTLFIYLLTWSGLQRCIATEIGVLQFKENCTI